MYSHTYLLQKEMVHQTVHTRYKTKSYKELVQLQINFSTVKNSSDDTVAVSYSR